LASLTNGAGDKVGGIVGGIILSVPSAGNGTGRTGLGAAAAE